MSHDTVIYTLKNRMMVRVGEPKAPNGIGFTNEERANFLIVCPYGDWSGFRTLKACLDQINETPGMLTKDDYYYQIVERL